MHAQDDRDQFAPPAPPARLRAISLAVLVHLALIGALTWGVNWKASSDQPAVQAELWSAVPQQAAPPEVTPPTPPTPPEPRPVPTPAPPPPPPPPPPRAVEPDTREADIAIEREKKRLEQEKKARAEKLEREKRERERKEDEREERLEKEKKEKLAEQKKAEQEKQKKLLAEEKRKAEEAKDAKEAKDAAAKKQRTEAEAKQLAAQREANLRRMQGLAGSEGNEKSTGTAQRDSGPSGSYGGLVAAKVKPNIVYPDAISGNPRAEVEVRLSPDGTIVGKRLVQSSGNKAWDDAVLRALEKTETLPRDIGGRAPPSSLTIGFRPQD
ncbi:MAG: cell envelope integrity protein TolA [Pseudomonadota bacterium]